MSSVELKVSAAPDAANGSDNGGQSNATIASAKIKLPAAATSMNGSNATSSSSAAPATPLTSPSSSNTPAGASPAVAKKVYSLAELIVPQRNSSKIERHVLSGEALRVHADPHERSSTLPSRKFDDDLLEAGSVSTTFCLSEYMSHLFSRLIQKQLCHTQKQVGTRLKSMNVDTASSSAASSSSSSSNNRFPSLHQLDAYAWSKMYESRQQHTNGNGQAARKRTRDSTKKVNKKRGREKKSAKGKDKEKGARKRRRAAGDDADNQDGNEQLAEPSPKKRGPKPRQAPHTSTAESHADTSSITAPSPSRRGRKPKHVS